MKTRWLALLIALAPLARGDEAKVQKGAWRVLVKPGARWILRDTISEDRKSKDTITVETYDVRKVAGADVARLRWTLRSGKETRDVGDSDSGRYTQVAVTDAGMYILSADMDDAKVTDALKRKPSRSDPPKPYKGTKQNNGRYLRVEGDLICMGFEPPPDAGDCDSVCDGEVCISPVDGVVKLEGQWAPGETIFAQKKYE